MLISGYEARNFLGVAIQCAACGTIAQTPALLPGAPVPSAVTVLTRGAAGSPTTIAAGTVLIGQEEATRLAGLFQPRRTDADTHTIGEAMLDDIAFQQQRWTDVPLDPSPAAYKDQPLAWAVAHLRERLRDPDWIWFQTDADMVALTVAAAFRDLFASWSHHPQFPAMIATAAAEGFSLHAGAFFGAAKAITVSGTRIGFATTPGPRPSIAELRIVIGEHDTMQVAVSRFDRFEWPDNRDVTQAVLRAAVTDAIASVQGRINRLHPGMLILSPGASDGTIDQLLADSMTAIVAAQGKRNRGLAAVAAILPRVLLTGKPREARFGYNFLPVSNKAFAAAAHSP